MGVKGFTTYINDNAQIFLDNFRLHNSFIVIDGNGIAINIYQNYTKSNDCFGGDYDMLANCMREFFSMLAKSKITPIVVFDGGYETKKLRTVHSRYRNRIKSFKRLNPTTEGRVQVYPLFTKEVFIDIAQEMKITLFRSDFEGDGDIVCLARKLKCPILGNDSDYFFFDVPYIPFNYFEMKAKSLSSRNGCTEYYIPCRIFYVEKFLKVHGGMSMEILPLLPVLLGNDYIKRSVLNAFYDHIKLQKNKHYSEHQNRIRSVIAWLRNETFQSAIQKMLSRFKSKERRLVAIKIKRAMKGYLQEDTVLLKYLKYKVVNQQSVNIANLDVMKIEEEIETDDENCFSDVEENSENSLNSEEFTDLFSEVECKDNDEFPNNEDKITENNSSFLDLYRVCRLPEIIMDMITRDTYFLVSQIEDYQLIHSHHINMKIMQFMYESIKDDNKTNDVKFKCLIRNNMSIKKEIMPDITEKIPKYEEIVKFNKNDKIKLMIKCLDISPNFLDYVNKFPESWQLFIVCLYYWTSNTTRTVDSSHVYSLILCSIILSVVDKKIGFIRSPKLLNTTIKSQNKTVIDESLFPKFTKLDLNARLIDRFESINIDDCFSCLKLVLNDFYMNDKLRYNVNLFDISVVDCFAEFQSAFYHIRFLNSYLGFPFTHSSISSFFNGTLLYNLTTSFRSRTNLKSYMELFLAPCSTILTCLNDVIAIIEEMTGQIPTSVARKKRKRSKPLSKSKEFKSEVQDDKLDDSSDDNGFVDKSNRFYALQNNL